MVFAEFQKLSTGFNGKDFTGPKTHVPYLGSDGVFKLDARLTYPNLVAKARERAEKLNGCTGFVIHRGQRFSDGKPIGPFEPLTRLDLLRTAVGLKWEDARQIVKLKDGNVYKHEWNAVTLQLYSGEAAYSQGVRDRLAGKRKDQCPYGIFIEYANHINWSTGYESADLAIELHGEEKVRASL